MFVINEIIEPHTIFLNKKVIHVPSLLGGWFFDTDTNNHMISE